MSPRSSAINVQYDLRPAKQAERRIFLQMFLSAAHLQFPISDARYVGMGGISSYDFITFHRYLNITKMVSIEHDKGMIPRCNFNNPFGFITLLHGTAGEFVTSDDFDGPQIVWLDYDQGVSEDVLSDLMDLGSKLKPNSFLIVSIRAEPGGPYRKMSGSDRLRELRRRVGDFAGGFNVEDMSDEKFRRVSSSLIRRFAIHSFASRSDAALCPLAQIQYRDETYMATFAAALCARDAGEALRARLQTDIRFLGDCTTEHFYSLRNFNLTESERRLFDSAVTSGIDEAVVRAKISDLGFEEDDVAGYGELMRYLPRYFEAFV